MQTVIIDAIRERQDVGFVYRGSPREVEPHTYGINTAGHEALSCFQVSESSRSGIAYEWKSLLVSEISSLAKTNRTFPRPRPEYVRDSKTFRQIFAQL